MYGLEAINTANGWAISVVGISIVFSGLVTLSIIISQLHRVLNIWENPSAIKKIFNKKDQKTGTSGKQARPACTCRKLTYSQKICAKQFAILAQSMDKHFSLPELLHRAVISDLKDPYSILNILLKSGIIVPDGRGFFTWDTETANRILAC